MSLESPVSVLFNTEGTELTVTASQSGSFLDGTQPGLLVMGSGSNGAQFLRLSDDGSLFITGSVFDLSVEMTGAILVSGAINQGDAGTVAESWYVRITDGTQVLGTGSSAPLFISGTVALEGGVVTLSGANFDPNGNLLVAVSGVNVVSGAFTVTGTVAIEEPVDVNIISPLQGGAVLVTGTLNAQPVKLPATVVTGVAASTVNFTALAANADRFKATFFMDGNSTAFIKLGAGASTTSFTVQLRNNAFYESPDNYTGQIDVVFNNNNANNVLRITEINES